MDEIVKKLAEQRIAKLNESADKIIIRSSSEHTEGPASKSPYPIYYGYVNIEHPTLGEFYVSVSIKGDVRLDGVPWEFIQKEYPLTPEQIEFVKSHEKEIGRFVKSGSPKLEINESKIEESESTGDVFLKLLPYAGATEYTDKAKLLDLFKSFLENPNHGGCFYVYWKENDTHYNNESVKDTFDSVIRYMKEGK